MARKLRIEYPGAIYHVINRGNYRRDVFESAGAAQAFQEALLEACDTFKWRLHAHVVMRNHFHLAVETPQGDLIAGMHWLQSTYATRFNRFRAERGHLFQGRYQALLIEDAAALGRVADYIHLNPVRAGIVPVEHLAGFRWSSLRWFLKPQRPQCLQGTDVLRQHGLSESSQGWKDYVDVLKRIAVDEAEQIRLGFDEFSRGYAIGSAGWRKAIAKEYGHLALAPGLMANEAKALRETRWGQLLEVEVQRRGLPLSVIEQEPLKSASWKIGVATDLRRAGVPYSWLAETLRMGSANSVRAYVNRFREKLHISA